MASLVTFAGALLNVGAVVSRTDTVNVAVAWLAALSCAVQVTVVLPSAKVEPEGGAHVTVTAASTVSLAVGFV